MPRGTPANKALFTRVKVEAKKKFKMWPSVYGSIWLYREYEKRGGKYVPGTLHSNGLNKALKKLKKK